MPWLDRSERFLTQSLFPSSFVRRFVSLLAGVALFWVASGLTWAAPSSQPAKAEKKANPQPEQIKLYVPYRRLGSVLNNQGVFLSKSQYQRLMGEIRRLRQKQRQALPVKYLLTQSWYNGVLDASSVQIKVVLELRILQGKAWIPVKLPFSGLPLLSATINDKPAMVFSPPNRSGYILLAKGQGTHRLALTFSGRSRRVVGGYNWSMNVPPTPQTSVALKWRGGPWTVNVLGQEVSLSPKSPEYKASVGPKSKLFASWQPKRKFKVSSRRLLAAKHVIESTLRKGLTITRALLQVRVVRGSVERLQVALPQGHRLIGIDMGTSLKQWSITKKNKQRVLQLALQKAMKGNLSIRLELNGFHKSKSKKVEIPRFKVLEAKWQHGIVGVFKDASLQLNVTQQQGLTQIEPDEFVQRSKGATPVFAFAFLAPNYQLSMEMKPVLPRIQAEVTHLVGVEDKQAFLETTVQYNIERAGVYRFAYELPKDWILRDVKCPNQQDHTTKDGKLTVFLSQRTGGPRLVRRVSRYNLWRYYRQTLGRRTLRRMNRSQLRRMQRSLLRKSSVTRLVQLLGQKTQVSSSPVTCRIKMYKRFKGTSLAVPFIKPLGVESERGKVGIFVPEHLELETQKTKGLLSLDDLSDFRSLRVAKHKVRQGYRYVGRPISGELKWRRKKTVIAATVWQPVKLRDDGYKVDGVVRYQARYSSTQTIKLAVPAALGASFRVVSDTREVRTKKGKKVWTYTIVLHQKIPTNGTYLLRYSYLRNFKKNFEVGQTKSLTLLSLRVPGAFRQTTLWGFQKEESISVSPTAAAGFERIDSSDLPAFAKGLELTNMVRTRANQPGSLVVQLRKHKYAKVLAATVTRLHVEIAVSLDGEAHVLAIARVRNRGRQFLTMGLPKGAQVIGLRVAGRNRYRFEVNKKGQLLVDLQYRSKGRPFYVVVRYKHNLPKTSKIAGLWGDASFKGPTIADTPVLDSSLQVYLPPRFSYVSFTSRMQHKNNRLDAWAVLRTLLWARRYSTYHWVYDISTLRSRAGDLSSQFPRRGVSFQFSSDDATLEAKATYRRGSLQSILEFVVALFALFLMMLFRRRDPSFNGSIRLLVTAAVFFAFAGALVPDSWVSLSYAAIVGSASAGGLWSVMWVFGGIRAFWSSWRGTKAKIDEQSGWSEVEDRLESSGAHKVSMADLNVDSSEGPSDASKAPKEPSREEGKDDESKEESP